MNVKMCKGYRCYLGTYNKVQILQVITKMITFNKISDGWPESHEMPRWQDASKLLICEATHKYKLCRFLHLHTEQFDGLLAIFTKRNVRRFRCCMLYYRLFVGSVHNTSKFYRLTQMTAAGALVLMELLCA